MNQLEAIKELIDKGNVDEAIGVLDQMLSSTTEQKDRLYYMLGNAYRKKGNWQAAMNQYQHAIDINPDSPAKSARKAIIDILDFYHKDMYNQ